MALLRTFPDPPLVYRDEFDNFTTFAWIMNYFAESEKMAMWLYDSCVKEYGPLSEQAGYQATRVAAVFHNQGDAEHARPWYFKAKEIMMQTETITSNKITCYLKVARCDLLAGKYELAEEEYQEVLAMAQFLMESIATYQTNSVGYLKLALADLHLACKETNEAERIYYEMMEFWKENLGVNLRVPQIYEKLGDTKIVKGCPLEAVSHYADALNYLDTYFPGDRERKQILEEKYAKARRGEVFEVKFQMSAL